MGLPLLSQRPEKKKENAAERALRETKEGLWSRATFDHVYWFQQHSAHFDMEEEESDHGDADVVDQDELDELEREVLQFAKKSSKSDDSSSSEDDEEEQASKSSKAKKKEGTYGDHFL
jgi:hypothetical protein